MEHESVDDMIRRQAAARREDHARANTSHGTMPTPHQAPAGWATFVRIAVLGLFVIFAWAMGQTPSSGLNAFGKLVAALFFLAAPLLYFLPTIEGKLRGQPNIVSIAIVNVLLGWTLVGWVVAMAWACKVHTQSVPATQPRPQPEPQHAPAAALNPASNASISVADEIRKLADLKSQGLLSEDEFATQKAKVLSR